MQISDSRIERILGIYRPEWRYMKIASSDFPSADGWFKLGETPYTTMPLEHVTVIELQACLNQLGYASFGQWIDEGRLEGLEMPFERFASLMSENELVIGGEILKDASHTFRKPIKKDHLMHVRIGLEDYRQFGSLYLAWADFNVDSSKAVGKLKLALAIKPKR